MPPDPAAVPESDPIFERFTTFLSTEPENEEQVNGSEQAHGSPSPGVESSTQRWAKRTIHYVYSDEEDDEPNPATAASARSEKRQKKTSHSRDFKMEVVSYYCTTRFRKWEDQVDGENIWSWHPPTHMQLKEKFPDIPQSTLSTWVHPRSIEKICRQAPHVKTQRGTRVARRYVPRKPRASKNNPRTQGNDSNSGGGPESTTCDDIDAEIPSSEESESEPEPVDPLNSSRYHATSTTSAIRAEKKYAAHNHAALPIVISRAYGATVWDPEGKQYLDFQCSNFALNHGHCHPKLIEAMVNQLKRFTVTSPTFHNDVFPKFSKKVTKMFGYDRVLPMNTGTEAVEMAMKIATAWAYKVKGVPKGKALIMSAENSSHGHTLCSPGPPSSNTTTGPTCPTTLKTLHYNSIPALEIALLFHGHETAALLLPPIQTSPYPSSTLTIPDPDYIQKAKQLCEKHQVLLICDEIQTGLGRTGKLLCSDGVLKPDLVILGESLAGGMAPISCVLGSKEVMLCCNEPGTEMSCPSSIYSGKPLSSAVALRALELLDEENVFANALEMGELFREKIRGLKLDVVKEVRGVGLLNAVVLDGGKVDGAWVGEVCAEMGRRGVLVGWEGEDGYHLTDGGGIVGATWGEANENGDGNRDVSVRFIPPLVVQREEIERAVETFGVVSRSLLL